MNTVNARAGRRPLVWSVILAVFAAVLCFVPLFDLLGYDFAFALGIAAAFAGVDVGHGVVLSRARARRATTWRALLVEVAAASTAPLVLPLLLSLANGLRVRNCNVGVGLQFYLLLPVASGLLGGWAGMGVGVVVRGPRRGRILAWCLPVVSLGWSAVRLYQDPGVFAYDAFGGYFPGPIYDEALRPPSVLWQFRAVNLLWWAAALGALAFFVPSSPEGPPRRSELTRGASSSPFSGWSGRRVAQLVAALALVFAAASTWRDRGRLGFHVRREDLARVLEGEKRSPRLVLRYARGSGLDGQELDLLLEDLAYRYDQLQTFFGVAPTQPITVYVFPSPEVKKALVGAANTLFARPWSREIFVNDDRFPTRHLRHEMAHVFAASFGDPFFGVSLRLRWLGPLPLPRLASGLVEGFAEAADFSEPVGPSTLHEEAQSILADGRGAPLTQILGTGFSTLSGARAYTLAGSFCRYLFDTRGRDRARQLYASAGDFEAVYGSSLAALETEWRRFLASVPVPAKDRAHAREQFRRPGIFQKVCAREQAARVAEARGLASSDPARALAVLDQACADDPHEPTLQLQRAELLASLGRREESSGLLDKLLGDRETTSPMKFRAASERATVDVHGGDLVHAAAALRQALTLATDEGEERTTTAKLRALADPAALRTLGRVLFGDDDAHGSLDPVLGFHLLTEFARLHPDEALGPYFIGRQLTTRDAWAGLPFLRRACEEPLPTHPLDETFTRECRRLLALTAYRAQQWNVAENAVNAWRAAAPSAAERLRAEDFASRIGWRRAKD